MLESARPPIPVSDDTAIDECRKSRRQRSRQASRLPQSPERPDETRVDHALFDGGGDTDGEVKHPEDRLEDLYSQESPRV